MKKEELTDDLLYSEVTEKFYFCLDTAEDDLVEGQELKDLKLVVCKPNYVPKLRIDDYSDILPEDPEMSEVEQLEQAVETFNDTIDGLIISWSPTTEKVE